MERAIQAYRDGKLKSQQEPLVIETQISVFLNEKELALLACSPINLPELAVGFLSSEGFLSCTDLPPTVQMRGDNQVWVNTTSPIEPPPVESGRFVNTASGRGFQPVTCLPPVETSVSFTAGHLVQILKCELDLPYLPKKGGAQCRAGSRGLPFGPFRGHRPA